jgi:hypothetical protein
MNNFIKGIIEEKFASKAQQRFFYAQAGKGGKKGKKWAKWAKEFSNKTDFDEIPDKVEKEEDIEEIVDKKGNISRSKKPSNLSSKGVTQRKTSDDVVKTGAGSMGIHGVHGTHTSLRYWAESDMSKALGFKDTMGKDEDFDDAEKHFEKELGLPDDEAKERMGQMGYDEKLPDDKVRLVENPKKFMEEYIESVLSKKNVSNDIVTKESEPTEEKEINPILLKQLSSLKNSLKKNNLNVDDVLKHLKNDE